LEYVTGDYYIQDAGSMLALALLDATPGEAICDLCASPGGKSSAILESLSEVVPQSLESPSIDGGWLLANEPIQTRVAILEYALARTGYPRFVTMNQDPSQVALRFPQRFDAVLVDAPCSGQALVANDKHDQNAFDQRLVDHSAARQRRILLEAIRLLKPGGRLVYSTCTFAIEENESQIEFLRDRFPGAWEPLRLESLAPWESPISSGCYRVWPHRDPSAGAFAAGLRLVGELGLEDDADMRSAKLTKHARNQDRPSKFHRVKKSPAHKAGRIPAIADESIPADHFELLNQVGLPKRLRIKLTDDRLSALADDIDVDQAIQDSRWPEMLVRSRDRWEPQYSLAIASGEYFVPHRTVELNQEQTRCYISGQAIAKLASDPASSPSEAKQSRLTPWCVASYGGKPVGWVKDAGNRFNNHLLKIGYHNLVLPRD
jgi:SAM-dependent methyltransferase/NOL1/NOP2/fmu family ribosome biogenesis protein